MKPEPIYFQSKGAEEHRFLSNFWLSPFTLSVEWDCGPMTFATVEHYYQAMKAVTYNDFRAIATAPTPREAKDLGAKIKMTHIWEAEGRNSYLLVKEQIMLAALQAKFRQNPELRAKLLGTQNRPLFEYAPWGDTHWGVDKDYMGRNMLGVLLMYVRSTIDRCG